jgi:hypothetical protein
MIIRFLICAYVVCSILTFGHSFNHQEKTYRLFNGNEIVRSDDAKAYQALMSGMLFPLYWSIKLFEVDK